MKKTRKVIAMVLVLALTVAMSVAGTIAYLSDTDSAKNTFTTGNVQIDLTEAVVVEDEDGNLVADGDNRNDVLTTELDEYDYGKIYPGQTIYKDPTIELLEGSEDAYLGAVVTVSIKDDQGAGVDVEDILGCGWKGMLKTNAILDGGFAATTVPAVEDHPLHLHNDLPVYGNTDYSVYQVPNTATGEYKFYFFIEPIKEAGDTVLLFDTVKIPATWGNEEMAKLANLEITVDAYAVQAHGFEDCYEAMTTAFDTVFSF